MIVVYIVVVKVFEQEAAFARVFPEVVVANSIAVVVVLEGMADEVFARRIMGFAQKLK